ncbi:hypothetical protein GCM10010521_29470 [Streptomyces rameus]|uniref:Uncharacterized protein n=1 Tax=Streptomyces rameus TaxID=68261 RepID=A0ABP6NAD0_9ACTN
MIVESVDSGDQIREARAGLYGKRVSRPELTAALPAHAISERKRSGPGRGTLSRGRNGAAYFTSTKSPAALTAGVVVVPAKEKR